MTLTQRPVAGESQRDAFARLKRDADALFKRIRRHYPRAKLEYVRVYETTKKGQPHSHYLLQAPYLPQRLLSAWWRQISGAPVVYIEEVDKARGARYYLSKYLSKGGNMPAGLRRYGMSEGAQLETHEDPGIPYGDYPHWTYSPTSFEQATEAYRLAGWSSHVGDDGGFRATEDGTYLPGGAYFETAEQFDRWLEASQINQWLFLAQLELLR